MFLLIFSNSYLDAMYYLVTNYTTVGYGDIVPKTTQERFITCFLQVAGVFLFGYLKNSLSELFENM
jgi:voltage-gated potassium channel